MAKQKITHAELAMRKCYQKALFCEVNKNGFLQKIVESELGLGNALSDGAVWRKFGRGTHIVSTKTLFRMIEIAEKKGWCDSKFFSPSISNASNELKVRDDKIIEDLIILWMQQFEVWAEQIEDMVHLSELGSRETKIEVVKILENAIKRILN